ncbi:copper chaperone PCu(A)C [Pseudonocardia xinjiangensis]|uniref:copper chaperone PCu(A)C n=1 Tax=Pseudonocardia xinjiangensis TaxID=75289 RepID=UPI003D8AE562
MNRIGVVGAILLTLLLLAGCGSRQAACPDLDRTTTELGTVDGQVGRLRLLSVAIASPGGRGSMHIAGDSAALLLTIANDGETEDVLIGAGADVAAQVVLRNGDAAPDPRVEVPVPPGPTAVLSEVTGPHLELSGLRETLQSGLRVPVTFEFRDAGSVTLTVPVRTYTDVRPDKYLEPVAVTAC